MGVEQFGIDVDVNIDTGESQGKVRELAEQLENIKKFKDSKIDLDMGLSKVDTKKIGSLIAMIKQMEGSNFSKAFEISDKSLSSLKQLKETAEQISKLSKKQTGLIDKNSFSGTNQQADDLVKQYKQAQKEVKSLQSQMSKTKDVQVLGALGGQLDGAYTKLEKLYSKMNETQKSSVSVFDNKHILEMEQVYGKVFDGIQTKAREFENRLNEISKSELIDRGELEKTKSLLDSILNMKFKDSQLLGFEPFSDALTDLEKLKKSISDLNKGSKLDGFNQSDLVKEWKNVQNIITSIKKDMASTTDKSSSQALSKKIKELNKELEKCYDKMSDVDKKTVDMISKFDRIKLDNSFTKNAGNLLDDVKKLESALTSIDKKDVFDGRKLNGYKTQLKNITESLDKNILDGTLDEKYLSKTKTKIEGLKSSFKSLGEEAEKSLKISNFTGGMEKQFDDIKNKFKDLTLDKDIEKIRKEFSKLGDVSIEKLPQEFEKINNKIQELRANAENTSKSFKDYNNITSVLGEIGDKFNKLNGAGAFNDADVTKYQERIESLIKTLNEINLKDKGASNFLEIILKDAKELQSELKAIKMPDLINQWKKLNTELTNYKTALSKSYDISSIEKLQQKIKATEDSMSSLVKKMGQSDTGKVLDLSSQSMEKLGSEFRNQSDKIIKDIDSIVNGLKQLGNQKVADNIGLNQLLEDLQRVKKEAQNGIISELVDENEMNKLNASFRETTARVEEFKNEYRESMKSLGDSSKHLSDWKKLNSEVKTLKENLSKAYDSSSIDRLEKDIKSAEQSMSHLVRKLGDKDFSEFMKISESTNRSLGEFFRKEADKSIKAIEEIENKLKTLSLKELTDADSIKSLSAVLSELKNDFKTNIGANSFDATKIREFNSVLSEAKGEVNLLESAINNMNKSADSSKLVKEYKELSKELNKAQTEMSRMKTQDGMAHWDKEINRIKESMKSLRSAMSGAELDFANMIDVSALTKLNNVFSKQIDKIRADANSLTDTLSKIGNVGSIDTGSLNKLENEIKDVINTLNSEGLSGRQLAELKNRLQGITDEVKGFEKIGNFASKIESELKQLEGVASSPATMQGIKRTREELEKLLKMPAGSNNIEKQMDRINSSLKTVQSTVKRTTDSFFDDFYGSLRTFTLGNLLGDAIQRGVYAVKDTLIGLDSAMRDMMKVAPADFSGTSSQLQQIKNEAIETAKAVGSSSESVIQGMSKALQTGAKTMQDALEIAKQSTIYANVGDLDQGTADTYIASTMSAFYGMDKALDPVKNKIKGMSAEYNNLTNMIDMANFAGNNFAISTGDVGSALQKSGAILSEYGLSLDESISLIVGAK